MMAARYPKLYQINPRLWLSELARHLQRAATLDDIPDLDLDRIAGLGFDWVWLLGVWQTGAKGREISRRDPGLRNGYLQVLPDLQDEDIPGSCFAIYAYTVHTDLGGEAALLRLRQRLKQRGLRLLLDFVPNHTALDHPWAYAQPEFYIQGDVDDLTCEPANYVRVESVHGNRVLAHGRDPYFPGWMDTLQLNYGNAGLQEAMIAELLRIARLCDGVRCDMAMLVLPEVFQRTWGIQALPFWPRAIPRVQHVFPEFLFMAEVYWDMEGELLQQGFDYAYDKRLYDRLKEQQPELVRQHLRADLNFQAKMVRFLENHDEQRAAKVFPDGMHQAAALITFLSPGMRFFHQGQLDGFRQHVPVHLSRGPVEPVDLQIQAFYMKLLGILQLPALRAGEWRLLDCAPAWEGNLSWDRFVAYWWQGANGERLLVVVNYAPEQSQCYVHLPEDGISDEKEGLQGFVRLEDLMSPVVYQRERAHLVSQGLYLDLPAWSRHVFSISG